MKHFFKFFLVASFVVTVFATGCQKYDDSELRGQINGLDGRMSKLESQVQTANQNISALQSLTAVLNDAIFVKSINDVSGGYEIKFSNGKTITLKNGVDGKTPVIGVKKDTDGKYYWTVDGEWLKDSAGNKVVAQGTDGVTPQLKIEDNCWYVSTDGGKTWTNAGKASGDSFFKSVTYDDCFVYVTLADGTKLTLSRGANGVQAISVIPDYSDGSAKVAPGTFTLRFDVLPEGTAASVAALGGSCFQLKVAYVQTKAAAGDVTTLPVSKVEASGNFLFVTTDGATLDEKVFDGKLAVSASLNVNDGVKSVTTGFFPLYYLTEKHVGHEYVDLGLSVKWATCNVGANSPEGYGDYFAWGEVEPYYKEGHSQDNPCSDWRSGRNGYNWNSYTWMDHAINDWQGITKYTFADGETAASWYSSGVFTGDKGDGVAHTTFADYAYEDDAARVNWGGSWRTPTLEEVKELMDKANCDWIPTEDYKGTGVQGYIVKSKKPGYTDKSIFLPHADSWYMEKIDVSYGRAGNYWIASLDTDRSSRYALSLFMNIALEPDSQPIKLSSASRALYGMTVRPVVE